VVVVGSKTVEMVRSDPPILSLAWSKEGWWNEWQIIVYGRSCYGKHKGKTLLGRPKMDGRLGLIYTFIFKK